MISQLEQLMADLNTPSRKRITPRPLPPPEERLKELKGFVELLADSFIDYDHYNVYDSVFRQRVDEIVESIKFDENSQHIEEFGEYIRATNSTKARDFLKFFMMILEYFGQN
jgi:hypothetical protein